MLELLLVRQEEMEQQTGTEGNVKIIGLILMRMMVIASEEWKGGEIDECILTYDEIQLHRCVCGEWLEVLVFVLRTGWKLEARYPYQS